MVRLLGRGGAGYKGDCVWGYPVGCRQFEEREEVTGHDGAKFLVTKARRAQSRTGRRDFFWGLGQGGNLFSQEEADYPVQKKKNKLSGREGA